MGNSLRDNLKNCVTGDRTHQVIVLSPAPPYNYHLALCWMEWCLGHDYCRKDCPKHGYEDCFSHLITDWETWLKIKKSHERINNEQKFTEPLPEHSGH